VALERQSIEKKDFPIGRRGYDPDAVDSHLTELADQVEEYKTASRRRAESLADSASEQVRMIVEAAENSANQIRADAEKEARDIRREARTEAASTREEATAQAGGYVANVSSATASTLERLDAIESELGGMTEALRTSVTRARADLQLLENHLVEVRDAVTPRPQFEPDTEPEAMPALGTPPPSLGAPSLGEASPEEPAAAEPSYGESSYAESPAGESSFGAPAPVQDLSAMSTTPLESADSAQPAEGYVYESESTTYESYEPATETTPEPASGEYTDDTEGARLIALNMALNGTPREEVDRYLAENFELNDRAGLIEEVYSSVEG
jgi:DivIVA domain-containing protein